MSVQWIHNPVPGRHGHKRFDTDEPVSRCPRLSESSADAGLLGSSPGSPVSGAPLSVTSAHQGPARIGQFLLVPLTDRPGVHSALDRPTGGAQRFRHGHRRGTALQGKPLHAIMYMTYIA